MNDKPAHLPSIAHAEGRKATWFELFFDLVFVTAVAGLSARCGEHYNLAGAAEFALLILVLWWLWLGHTFHASRFNKDRLRQRLTGFAQMLAMVLVAYGTGDASGERATAVALGIAAFKALLTASPLSQSHRRVLAVSSGCMPGSTSSRRSPAQVPFLSIPTCASYSGPRLSRLMSCRPSSWQRKHRVHRRILNICRSVSACSPSSCSVKAWHLPLTDWITLAT